MTPNFPSIIMNLFGFILDLLGITMDVPCPLIDPLLYQNLARYS